jgi:hypothetical protein
MFEVSVRTDIAAPVHEAWAVLADLSGFDAWNPLIVHVSDRLPAGWASDADRAETGLRLGDGHLRPEDPITIHVALEGGTVPLSVTVSRADTEREFGWRFVQRHRLLYRGEHVWRLEDAGDGTTRLIDSERFWGLLVPFRRRALQERITASMTLMGRALKERVESRDRGVEAPAG